MPKAPSIEELLKKTGTAGGAAVTATTPVKPSSSATKKATRTELTTEQVLEQKKEEIRLANLEKIAKAEAILRSARAWMYEITEEIWDKAVRDAEITVRDRAMLRMACAHTAFEGARATDIAYTLGGGTSIYEKSVLQRCMRDAHAATQHIMHALPNYELAGRVILGLDPGTPML